MEAEGGAPRTDLSAEEEADRQTEKYALNKHLAAAEVNEKKKNPQKNNRGTTNWPTGKGQLCRPTPPTSSELLSPSDSESESDAEPSRQAVEVPTSSAVAETARSGATTSPEEQGNLAKPWKDRKEAGPDHQRRRRENRDRSE